MVFVGMVNMMNEIMLNHIKYGQMVLALKSASDFFQWHISQMPPSYTILQLAEAFFTAASGGTSNACPRADHHRHHRPGWDGPQMPGARGSGAWERQDGPWMAHAKASEMIHEK